MTKQRFYPGNEPADYADRVRAFELEYGMTTSDAQGAVDAEIYIEQRDQDKT